MKRKDQLRLYREQMGDEKAKKQATLAKFLHTCCGEPKDGPHHALCRGRRW